MNKTDEKPESVWASIVDGLEKKEDREVYSDSIFWLKGGQVYFEYCDCGSKKYLWCRQTLVWSVFESKFGWDEEKVCSFIDSNVDEYFNLKGVVCIELVTPAIWMVERYFNFGATANYPYLSHKNMIEHFLKLKG